MQSCMLIDCEPLMQSHLSKELNAMLCELYGQIAIVLSSHSHMPCSHTGSHIIELLRGEFRTWDGGLMVVSGFWPVVVGSSSAKALG